MLRDNVHQATSENLVTLILAACKAASYMEDEVCIRRGLQYTALHPSHH